MSSNSEKVKRKISNKAKGSIGIVALIAFIVIGYAFFFASPRIFAPNEDDLLITETGKEVSINTSHKVKIEDWIYSEKEQKMQVVLSLISTSLDASEKYVYKAVSRTQAKEAEQVSVNVTYQSSSFANLIIENVPKNFCEMAISVGYIDKHAEEQSKGKDDKDIEAAFTTIYTNVYKVSKADKIEPMSVLDIYIGKINDNINEWNEEIENLTDEIELNKSKQEDILQVVAELQQNKKYMTANEAEKIEAQITSYKTSYDKYSKMIESDEAEISELNDKVTSAKAKQAEIKQIIDSQQSD